MDILLLILSAVIGYLLGSINGAVLISRIFYGSDVRHHGSGNAGMTNMLRTFGKKAAGGTFLVDMLKGIVATVLCGFMVKWFGNHYDYWMGACIGGGFSILGHNWPVYFGFKGGKGVLTTFAVVAVLTHQTAFCTLLVFVLVIAIFRYVSLGAIVAAVMFPVFAFFFSGISPVFFLVLIASVMIICRHHANIGRLIRGTESKLGQKAKKE